MSILRLDGRPSRGRHVRHPRRRSTAAIALGDRIGLVGPNGAGKTTLLRIAAGTRRARRGTVARKRGLSHRAARPGGALRRGVHGRAGPATGGPHGAAHLERDGRRARARSSTPAASRSPATRSSSTSSTSSAATRSTSGSTRRCPASASARDDWIRPPTALSGGEQTRAALARLVIADPDLLFLDEPTNHLDLGALEWLEEHLRRRPGSLLVASHDRAFLDATVTRDLGAARPAADGVPRRLQRLPPPARGARRPRGKDADGHAESIARERELVQRYRSHRKFSKMHEHEARLERLQADGSRRPKAGRKLRLPGRALAGGGPVRSGEIVVRIEDLVVGYLPGRGALPRTARPRPSHGRGARPVPRRAARRSDRDRRAERGRQDDAPADDRRASCRRSTARSTFGNAVQLGLPRPAARRGDPGRDGPRRAARGDPGHARRGARLPRPVPVPWRRRVQGGPLAVGRRAVAARARAARDHAVEPAAARRADEPPRHPGPRGDRVVPARHAGHAARRVATTGGCSRRSASGCGSSATGRRLPFDGGYRAWRAAVADGWTVAAAAEQAASGCARRSRRRRARRRRGGELRRGPASAGRRRAGDARTAAARPAARREPRKLSKDAYRRQRAVARRGADAGSGCARATSSWRWATRRWPRTSSSCGGSRASSPTSRRRSRSAEDAWLDARGAARRDDACPSGSG